MVPGPDRSRPALRPHAHRAAGGERLPQWLAAVSQDDLPSLHTLAAGIDPDRDAVIAGLTLPWNSGVVEGHVNRIKMLKRQMLGRAGFDLLRKRVLLAP
ncbi:transposase [Streptomyces gardneri]|uniref:transposase n=1 Tax=Streptomyces gardneri TaxID=66892 RepID=UPI0036AED1D6